MIRVGTVPLVDAMVAFADDDKVEREERSEPELAPLPARLSAGAAGEDVSVYDSGVEPPGFRNYSPDAIAYEEFEAPLDPYGDWLQSSDYGPVFRPDEDYTSDNWAPYTNGSWGQSDYGWTWSSRDPFGWACDHYGRWTRLDEHGWCWVPGREWATAWVSWRSNGKHIGWVPLPPGATWNRELGIGGWVDAHAGIGPGNYNFVSISDFGAPNSSTLIVDRARNAELFATTDNVTRLHFQDGCVHNDGPNVGLVRAGSDHLIRRLKIDAAKERRKLLDRLALVRPVRSEPLENAATTRVDRGWRQIESRPERRQLQLKAVADARRALTPRRGYSVTLNQRGAGMMLTAMPEPRLLQPESILKRDADGPPPSRGRTGEQLPDHLLAERERQQEALSEREQILAERERLVAERKEKEKLALQRIDDVIAERQQRREELGQQALAKLERIRAQRAKVEERPVIASAETAPRENQNFSSGQQDQARDRNGSSNETASQSSRQILGSRTPAKTSRRIQLPQTSQRQAPTVVSKTPTQRPTPNRVVNRPTVNRPTVQRIPETTRTVQLPARNPERTQQPSAPRVNRPAKTPAQVPARTSTRTPAKTSARRAPNVNSRGKTTVPTKRKR